MLLNSTASLLVSVATFSLMSGFLCSSEEVRATNISQKRRLEENNIPSLVVYEEDEDDWGAILGVLFLLLLGGVAFKMKDKILKALGGRKGGVGSMMSNNNKAAAKYHEM
jgi:hypothetical protein